MLKSGKEEEIKPKLKKINILILNHGINLQANQTNEDINNSIEINALSTWRLLEMFETIAKEKNNPSIIQEVWINTSEAEIQPALSPTYEISKKLLGELISLKKNNLTQEEKKLLRIRKIILGPFRSKLNPIGIMPASFVANQILLQSDIGLNLIIVTPNPLTYLFIPLTEIFRYTYSKLTKIISPKVNI